MLPEMRARTPREEKERLLFRHVARNYGVFHRKEALTFGFSNSAISRLVETGRAERVWPFLPHVVCPGDIRSEGKGSDPLCRRRRMALASLAASDHGMTETVSGPVEIVTNREQRSRPGLKILRVGDMPRHDVRTLRFIPVTNTIRTMMTWLQFSLRSGSSSCSTIASGGAWRLCPDRSVVWTNSARVGEVAQERCAACWPSVTTGASCRSTSSSESY